MARLRRSVGIAAIKTNLPRRASIGPAVINIAGTVADEAFRRTADKRVQEANAAAEGMDFERNEEGILIAPKMPRGDDGLIAPNIYSRQYSEMAGKRYLHQMQLDVTKSLNGIAVTHRNDPNGFEAASSKYLETTLSGALPEVRAEVDLMGQGIQVGHFNRLVRERSEFEFKKSQDMFAAKMELGFNELTGAVQGGADPISASLLQVALIDEYSAATEEGLVNGAGLPQLQLSLNQSISKARLAHRSESVPSNDVSERAFMREIQGLIEEDGQIETLVDGEYQFVDVANVFPSRADRQELINNISGFIGDRITLRNQLDAAQDNAEREEYLIREYPKLISAVKNGYRYERDFTTDMLDSVARNPSLFDLQNNLSAITDSHNEDLLERNRTAADLEFAFNGLELSFRSLTPDMMNMIDDVSESIFGNGVDFMTAINGEIDPDPLSRQQTFNQLQAIMRQFGQTTDGKMSEAQRELIEQMTALGLEHQRNQAEVIANAPDRDDGTRPEVWGDLTPEEQRIGTEEMLRSQPGLNLTQNKPAARLADDQLHALWGETGEPGREWTSWGNLTPQQFTQRMGDMEDRGIIPSSFTLWTQGALTNVQDLEPEEFTRLMDYAEFIYSHPRLSKKANQAFGNRQDAAMWFIHAKAGPSLKQFDTKQMRDAAADIMDGKDVLRDWFKDFDPEERKEIRDAMDNEFSDNYVELWPGWFGIGDKDELSVSRMPFAGEVVHIPKAFSDRYKELAIGYANIYSMDTKSGRKQAYASAADQILQEGWTLDKDAISATFPETIFGLGFLEGISDNLITNRPSAIWRNDSLRGVIDDEDVIQASYKEAEAFIKTSTSWAAFNPGALRIPTPKVGINVQIVRADGPYDGRFMRENGDLEYGFIAWGLDGQGNARMIQDEENLNNNKIFFFGLTQAQIQERKDRMRRESSSSSERNKSRRELLQERDRINEAAGISPHMGIE